MTFDYIDPFHISEIVDQTTVTQSFYIATATVLVYDSLLSMDKEIRYFWDRDKKFGFVHVLYFTNRYIGILGALSILLLSSKNASTIHCQYSVWVHNGANVINISIIDYILVLRITALWGNSLALSIALKFLVLLVTIFRFYVYVRIFQFSDYESISIVPGLAFCGRFKLKALISKLGLVTWIVPMITGIFFLLLAIYKCREYWIPSEGFRGFHLVRVLIQDQLFFYFAVVFCCALNIVFYEIDLANVFLTDVLAVAGSPTFLCVLGSRMLFNLKEAAEKGSGEETSYREDVPISAMEFS